MRHLIVLAVERASLLSLLLLIGVGSAACGGQQVEPLNPRDLTLPVETRRWIAAAEDGVIVARARRDAAQAELDRTRAQQERRLDETVLGANGVKLLDKMEARLKLLNAFAGAKLDRAEAVLALADAKYRLVTAEQAILRDLASYDLEELKLQVDKARQRLYAARKELRERRDALDRSTTAFWQAYADYLKGGGETISFWIGRESPLRIGKK
jgi:hypothetical protein